MPKPQTIICTVGTSLFKPNLFGLPSDDAYADWLNKQPERDRPLLSLEIIHRLRQHLQDQQWEQIAQDLTRLDGSTRLCGAEINSIHDLILNDYCQPSLHIVLCHSATEEARKIAEILKVYFRRNPGHHTTATVEIDGLIDSNPKTFRTQGLRNLVKALGKTYQDAKTPVAINATGGYKAQIAIAVLVGQALGIPVFYKHERFSEIIPFPPMPIDLDFNLWLAQYHWFHAFETHDILQWQVLCQDGLTADWDERMEPLVEKEGNEMALSPVGQIFHERFKQKYADHLLALLPLHSDRKVEAHISPFEELTLAPAANNKEPSMSQHGWRQARSPIKHFMQRIVDEAPYVKTCRTYYWSPDLGQPTHFRVSRGEIDGIFSNGSWTTKFKVVTTATTDQQRQCAVVDLNQRFAS
ncbi:putative CRISPR-associated protein [Lyngbya confervoides]|uniref:CRISPR-associated protein n=1 Tax=Lyngbya confervoides BDU141951 TaxID=1574623 RepID=A0ABD4T5F2_9CYAN|nr:putative CRISPR-associated protein [Lyngbya confervoides]MCM1983752.1 putative CRISPR-associated protein [Lyngbya confervoides BDU141951]